MKEADLLNSCFSAVAAVRSNFEFWLSSTFALVIAFHFVGVRMSLYFRFLLVIIYFGSALLLLINWLNAGLLAVSLVGQIESISPHINVRPIGGFLAPQLNFALMILGTIASTYYALTAHREGRANER